MTYTGAEPNSRMSFKKSDSSAEEASQRTGCPCPWESLSRQTNSHCALNDPPTYCSASIEISVLAHRHCDWQLKHKDQTEEAETPPGMELKKMQEQITPSVFSRMRTRRGQLRCGAPESQGTGALPRCISGNPNVSPCTSKVTSKPVSSSSGQSYCCETPEQGGQKESKMNKTEGKWGFSQIYAEGKLWGYLHHLKSLSPLGP